MLTTDGTHLRRGLSLDSSREAASMDRSAWTLFSQKQTVDAVHSENLNFHLFL